MNPELWTNVKREKTRKDKTGDTGFQAEAELTCFKVVEVPFVSQEPPEGHVGDTDR